MPTMRTSLQCGTGATKSMWNANTGVGLEQWKAANEARWTKLRHGIGKNRKLITNHPKAWLPESREQAEG